MEQIEIQAKYHSTIYHNESNYYTVARFISCEGVEKEFSAVGNFYERVVGMVYLLKGTYVEHPRYGLQFQVDSYQKFLPNDQNSLIRFFSSSIFPGIGDKTARQIVEVLQEDAIAKIQANPNVLDQISNLNEKKKEVIKAGIEQFSGMDECVLFLTSLNIAMANILRIKDFYKDQAMQIIQANPYQLMYDLDGIGFATADKIAMQLQFGEEHPARLQAIVYKSVLQICMDTGNTYVYLEELMKEIHRHIEMNIQQCQSCIQELLIQRRLIVEEDRIYHPSQYDAECGIASFLQGFPYVDEISLSTQECLQELQQLEETFAIQYDIYQKEAIQQIIKHPFSILTGGPGTGKTTIVKAILEIYKRLLPSCKFTICAPTGRAAKRLSQLSESDACTIHSLLKWDLSKNEFLKNGDDPIVCDILIIDEFSMVDAYLFYHLIRASKQVSKILLIGDEDQLPSVGPGCVLKDLLACKLFPIYCLNHIYRQQEGSGVVELAHQIKNNETLTLDNKKDVIFIPCQPQQIKQHIVALIHNAMEKGYGKEEIQVLAPIYRGIAGIDLLNHAIQEIVTPPTMQQIQHIDRIFRVNDKVLQLKNQPEDDVFNGDIGVVIDIEEVLEGNSKQKKVVVAFDDRIVTYEKEQLYNITHAYCISIHKSQGSEYPIVILPITKQYRYMLQKRLYYTAITRAKKILLLVGEKEAFCAAIENKNEKVRRSTLQRRLENLIV